MYYISSLRKPSEATFQLEECIRTFPLRRTASGVNTTSANDLLQMVLKVVNNNNSAATKEIPALEAAPPVLALLDGKMEDSQESQEGSNPPLALHDKVHSQPVAETEELEVNVKKAEMKQQALKVHPVQKQKRNITEVLDGLKKAFVQDNASRKERRLQDGAELEKPATMKTEDDKPQESKDSRDVGKGTQKKTGSKVEPKKKSQSSGKDEKKKKKEALPSKKGREKQEQPKKKQEANPKQLKMDRKCFTSRAYHRAYDLNFKKNGDKEAAKALARQALQEASMQWDQEFGNQ